MNKYEWAVYPGRFQPYHNGHHATTKYALSIAENLIIALGSYKTAPNIKNPWTAEEREEMIRACLTPEENSRVFFVYIRDHFYNENRWINEMQREVGRVTDNSKSVTLVGNLKDDSSYYLKSFPQWDFNPAGFPNGILNATDIRNHYFGHIPTNDSRIKDCIPFAMHEYLYWWKYNGNEKRFSNLAKEYEFVQSYKKLWENAPYAPTFVTADAVVVCGGHVLVVRRKGHPGNGQIALPGGFIGPNETIETAAIRELKEETRIELTKTALKNNIVSHKYFDYPDRSTRGRTITHAFFIALDSHPLPKVKGSDDADKAWWMPVSELADRQEEFYEDHWHIINSFIYIN